jgi:Na+-driven multidrug efflux pump
MIAFAGHYLAQLGVFDPIFDPAGNSIVNWVLVASNALAALANNATRSKKERAVWGVTTILMFVASLVVALQL